jgi:glucosamine--fructose-6-phosphate aminotransferase (isomerizing)
MCGIVAVTGYKKALPLLLNGLEKLEYRGYDSAGIAVINSETKNITCNKTEGKLKNLINNLNDKNIPETACPTDFLSIRVYLGDETSRSMGLAY